MHITNYSANYYSISDIIVTQEKIPCTAENLVHGLGTVDTSFDEPNIAAGQTIELPLWYAAQSSAPRSRTFRFQIPEVYEKKLKDICEADALAVDLGRMNQFYYMFGQYISRFDRSNTVSAMLYEMCRSRCRSLIDLCKDTAKGLKNSKKFDHIELQLYTRGCRMNEKFGRWLTGSEALLHTPSMVTSHQKRRRAHMDPDGEENTRLSKSPRF